MCGGILLSFAVFFLEGRLVPRNVQLLEEITACGFVDVSCLVKANGDQHFVEVSLALRHPS